MNPDPCIECGTELTKIDGTPIEWYCPGDCPREQILWRTSTGGKLHTDIGCSYLQDAERQHTQRDARKYERENYCAYCMDDVEAVTQADYDTLAKAIKYSNDHETAIAEFFEGEC